MPPLVGEGGGLVCESVGWADLLSNHFDRKQSSEAVDQPLTCHPSPSLITFAFRSSEAKRLLLDLDHMVALTQWVCFLIFFKRTDVLAPVLASVLFRQHLRLVSFLASRIMANVALIPKGPQSLFSITDRVY